MYICLPITVYYILCSSTASLEVAPHLTQKAGSEVGVCEDACGAGRQTKQSQYELRQLRYQVRVISDRMGYPDCSEGLLDLRLSVCIQCWLHSCGSHTP